jgi:CMP-N-acetylneuraminic acid synthetase
MIAWGLVPARGGSKSIPLKNLVPLAGRPLIDYVIEAGLVSGALARIVCSTDHDDIAERAQQLGIEVDRRPSHLAGDTAPVDEVARDFLQRKLAESDPPPDIVVLLQPTSPFLRGRDVAEMVEAFGRAPAARSMHNVYPVPHNLHAWNQRSLAADGGVSFLFEHERSRARNKQAKPKLFAFGNLIAARIEALVAGDGFYAKPCHALTIPPQFAFDLDRPEDIAVAEAMLRSGVVDIDHLTRSAASAYANHSQVNKR